MTVHTSVRGIAFSVAVLLAGVAGSPAHAFADDDARRAILDLREQVHQMNEQNRRIRLDFAEQLELLQQEVTTLRGQIEQLQYSSSARQRGSLGAPDSGVAVADMAEQAAFDRAMDMFNGGRYREAVDGFNSFLEGYPASALAVQARFYRGSGQYAIKDFHGSIQGLTALVDEHPDHARAPDALLIIATDQVELNDLVRAKATMERIVQDYPDSVAAGKARERLKLL